MQACMRLIAPNFPSTVLHSPHQGICYLGPAGLKSSPLATPGTTQLWTQAAQVHLENGTDFTAAPLSPNQSTHRQKIGQVRQYYSIFFLKKKKQPYRRLQSIAWK